MTKVTKGLIIGLCAALLGLSVLSVFFYQDAQAARLQQQAQTRSAALQIREDLSAMETALGKLLVSSEPELRVGYLAQVIRKSEAIMKSLSFLPGGQQEAGAVTGYLSESGAYAYTLLTSVMGDEDFRARDASQLAEMLAYARSLSARALTLSQAGAAPEAVIDALRGMPAAQMTEQAEESGVSVPTLIYDGAFADNRLSVKAENLGSERVTREQAQKTLEAFLQGRPVSAIEPLADTDGALSSYGFYVTLQDIRLYAEVTRVGGHVLLMMPESASFSELTDMPACIVAASAFLRAHGMEDIEPTYFQQYNGLAVINFAPVVGGVLMYPDLIKVQVRMDTAEVVGYEGTNYLLNRHERALEPPVFTASDARTAAAERGVVQSVRLCVIPYRGGERYCHEIGLSVNGTEYLLYLDAVTGAETEILQLISTATGLLTL